MKYAFKRSNGAFVLLGTLFFIAILMLLRISAIPWAFAYLEIGRLIGPIPALILLVSILLVLTIIGVHFLNSTKQDITLRELKALMKKKKTIGMMVLSLLMSLLLIFSFSAVFMSQVSQSSGKIDAFISENVNLDFEDYVSKVCSFLDENLHNAYGKAEVLFKIDIQISSTLLDSYIMGFWKVTRIDLIIYQGWGTCEQAAILIEELLYDAGYETRQAHFKDIIHQWAEVSNNGKWFIIDPWYIGNLVEIQNLRNTKPAFQQASGVEVQYRNGTIIDASPEHGY
jgi:hypothetical protein